MYTYIRHDRRRLMLTEKRTLSQHLHDNQDANNTVIKTARMRALLYLDTIPIALLENTGLRSGKCEGL